MRTGVYDERVVRQAEDLPGMYGNVDFSIVPERYDTEATPDDPRFAKRREAVARVFDNPELRDLILNATMTGDRVGDAYAALIPEYGFRALVDMLDQACEKGVENVEDAPSELVDLIHAMEATPDWLDMELVTKGAAAERLPMATVTPMTIRGAFLATFLNKYAARPMTMTGTLSDEASAQRVFETASFFTATTLPGALDRDGKGFHAAAKVRLMHSMVRFHLLNSGEWDVATYGIPIPQSDQMPAGTMLTFLAAGQVLRKGKADFNDTQRATVELARYRCFLLGLPENLLGRTPHEVVDLLTGLLVSLREGYDETCKELVRGTLDAELFDRSTIKGRMHTWFETGMSRWLVVNSFLDGDKAKAELLGITFGWRERIAVAIALPALIATRTFYRVGLRVPVLKDLLGDHLNKRLARLLHSYGHADFVTDADRYKLKATA